MEERREPRYPVKTTATLRVLSDADLGVCVTVIIDISRSGVRAECARFLRHGSQVSIETKELTVIGTVQNCTEIRRGLFGVGIGVGNITPHPISPSNSM
jgi:PilZ domain